MKQIAKALTTSTLALGLATPLLAQVTLSVGAITDIYRAGGYNDGSDGGAPVAYAFTARPFQTLTFSSVTGAWTCNNSVPEYGPDGTTGSCYHTGGQDIDDAAAPFSAYDLTDFAGAMVGVFLEDALPSAAPASLRFYVSDNSQGGIQTDFKALAPKIGQVFFIGDGLTGTGSGSTQVFAIPPTATRLYLGYADTCSQQPGPAAPGCYSDNAGSLTAIFQIEDHELNWVEPQEQVSPAGRCCMGMAYDPSMRSTLLFGGYTNPTFLNDTWTWTLRQGWSQLSPAASPSPREAPGMAYDGAAQNMVLFGGTTSDGTYLNDTWIWDGTAWTQQSPAVSPSVRQFATMTYDAATGTIVLFGGLASGSAPLGDTWTWDHEDVDPAVSGIESLPAGAYDDLRQCYRDGPALWRLQRRRQFIQRYLDLGWHDLDPAVSGVRPGRAATGYGGV